MEVPNFSLSRPTRTLGHSGGPGGAQLRARGFASSHFQAVGAPQPCPLRTVRKESGARPAGRLPGRSQPFPAHLPPPSGRAAPGKRRSGAGRGPGPGGSGPSAFLPAAPRCRGWHRSGGVRSSKPSRGHLAACSSQGKRQAATSACLKLNLKLKQSPRPAASHGSAGPPRF